MSNPCWYEHTTPRKQDDTMWLSAFLGGVGGWNVFRNFEGPHPLEIPGPKGSDVQETSVSLSDIYMILLRACLEQKNSQVESIAPQPLTAQKALEQSR